jgi:hypothetical protein
VPVKRISGWNLLLGVVAAIVSAGMALLCAVALMENMFLLSNLEGTSLARNAGQYLFLGASALYSGLFIAQLSFTILLFRRRRDDGVYLPALVVTMVNVIFIVLMPVVAGLPWALGML